MVLHLIAVLVLGLMCGSELNVGLLALPALNREPLETHIRARAALARLLGRVMPFWMVVSTLLNLAVLLPFAHLTGSAWRLAAVAFCIQLAALIFSPIFLVPINNRIARWTVESLPNEWQRQEHLRDIYHLSRTFALVVAFAALTMSLASK